MDTFEKLLALTLRFLSFRPRTEKEIIEYLKKKSYPQEQKDQVIAYLKDRRFIDDEEFARWLVDQRTRVTPKGERFIRMELKQKGISEEIITSVFNTKTEDTIDQVAIAKALIEKKLSRYSHLSRREFYQKMGALLARRGFDWETIKKSLDSVLIRS